MIFRNHKQHFEDLQKLLGLELIVRLMLGR